MDEQETLCGEDFQSENFDPDDNSSRESPCECGPAAGFSQVAPNQWWYSHIGHRRRYRTLRLLTRKGIHSP